MTEEEIKAMQEENAKLKEDGEKSAADLKAEQEARAADAEKNEKTIAEKDALIKQKTEDVVGVRKKFKTLKDMSDEEKEAMTEKEIELQERQEALDARQAKAEEIQRETLQKEIDARKADAIKAVAGDDEELAAKVAANYDRIADSKTAQTPAEIGALAKDAYNMLGVPAASNPVTDAYGGGGDGKVGGEGEKDDFSETERGKNLAGSLGLGQVNSEDNNS